MKVQVYVGTANTRRAYVVGHQFGPCMIARDCGMDEALDEWDERFGERVEVGDPALADYNGSDYAERVVSAMDVGDIRINDGGSIVWVDHYEWLKEFPSLDDAKKFCEDFARLGVEYV